MGSLDFKPLLGGWSVVVGHLANIFLDAGSFWRCLARKLVQIPLALLSDLLVKDEVTTYHLR